MNSSVRQKNEQRGSKKKQKVLCCKTVKVVHRKSSRTSKPGHQSLVDRANSIVSPLAQFPSFQKFETNDFIATLECKQVTNIDPATVQVMFALLEKNMKILYENSSWGWNGKAKYKEMTEASAWYVIVRNVSQDVIAFSHFRFDMDYGKEVLYVYELQLDSSVQRKGLGTFIMQFLELLCVYTKMRKVVLTVLKHNVSSVKFYYSLGYTVDITSPVDSKNETYTYEILSKPRKNISSTHGH